MITHNSKTGRGRKTCSYETELSPILLKKDSILPPAIMSRHGLVINRKNDIGEDEEARDEDSNFIPICAGPSQGECGPSREGENNTPQPVQMSSPSPVSHPFENVRARRKDGRTVLFLEKVRDDMNANTEKIVSSINEGMEKTVQGRNRQNELMEERNRLLARLLAIY